MPASKNKVSVVIIARNEEQQIAECIASCLPLSDDIIVVDSGSNDKTIEVAKGSGARVFEKEWTGYGGSRNYGTDQAIHDWVLHVDADERPDHEMITSIGNIDLEKDTIYSFHRLNYVGQKAILHGEWNPDIKQRLYYRHTTNWDNKAVHEALIMAPSQKSITLPGVIHHYSYTDLSDIKNRLEEYARLGAEELSRSNIGPGFKAKYKPVFRFLKSYYLKGGYKDGKIGKEIAQLIAEAERKKYRFLKEMINKS